jgi:NAD-dependent deacetylase
MQIFHDRTFAAAGGMDEAIDELAGLVQRARRAVIFTGAGISTECGVPDFRSPGGLWERLKPTPFKEFVNSEAARLKAWRNYREIHASFGNARPGRGHRVCAGLIADGHAAAVVTQNIDDLHRRAGVAADNIVELHGNGTYAKCLACGERHELAWVWDYLEREDRPPLCAACGGLVKSATIAFGQPMPEAAMRKATALTRASDLFLAIGSSLTVYPAAALPLLAAEQGVPLVIVNGEETPLDMTAALVLRGDIGEILVEMERRRANHQA